MDLKNFKLLSLHHSSLAKLILKLVQVKTIKKILNYFFIKTRYNNNESTLMLATYSLLKEDNKFYFLKKNTQSQLLKININDDENIKVPHVFIKLTKIHLLNENIIFTDLTKNIYNYVIMLKLLNYFTKFCFLNYCHLLQEIISDIGMWIFLYLIK